MRQDISALAGALSELQEVSAELATASGDRGPGSTRALYGPEVYLAETSYVERPDGNPGKLKVLRNNN